MTERVSWLRPRWAGLSVGAIGLAAMLVLALGITLYPTPVDRGMRGTALAILDVFHSLGMPESFGYAEPEFAANVLMFVLLPSAFSSHYL